MQLLGKEMLTTVHGQNTATFAQSIDRLALSAIDYNGARGLPLEGFRSSSPPLKVRVPGLFTGGLVVGRTLGAQELNVDTGGEDRHLARPLPLLPDLLLELDRLVLLARQVQDPLQQLVGAASREGEDVRIREGVSLLQGVPVRIVVAAVVPRRPVVRSAPGGWQAEPPCLAPSLFAQVPI